MAEPKRRDRPKGAEIRDSLKPQKEIQKRLQLPALPDRFTEQDMRNIRAKQKLLEQGYSDQDISKKDMVGSTDPYLSRNEFKPGFYDQPKPPVSYETLKGTAAKPIPNVTDTESFAEGGSVRGQKNIQVKKKQFKGIF